MTIEPLAISECYEWAPTPAATSRTPARRIDALQDLLDLHDFEMERHRVRIGWIRPANPLLDGSTLVREGWHIECRRLHHPAAIECWIVEAIS